MKFGFKVTNVVGHFLVAKSARRRALRNVGTGQQLEVRSVLSGSGIADATASMLAAAANTAPQASGTGATSAPDPQTAMYAALASATSTLVPSATSPAVSTTSTSTTPTTMTGSSSTPSPTASSSPTMPSTTSGYTVTLGVISSYQNGSQVITTTVTGLPPGQGTFTLEFDGALAGHSIQITGSGTFKLTLAQPVHGVASVELIKPNGTAIANTTFYLY